jgi:hypothetical protein
MQGFNKAFLLQKRGNTKKNFRTLTGSIYPVIPQMKITAYYKKVVIHLLYKK